MNSSNTLGKEKIDEPEDHGIYNQVNENAIELQVLSGDGYCLPHGAHAYVDSHMASGYDKVKDCPGDYGEVNWKKKICVSTRMGSRFDWLFEARKLYYAEFNSCHESKTG